MKLSSIDFLIWFSSGKANFEHFFLSYSCSKRISLSKMRTSFLMTISGNFFHQMRTLQPPDVLLYIYCFIMFYEVPMIVQHAQHYLSSMELRFWCPLTSVLKIVAYFCILNLFLTARYGYFITIGSLNGNFFDSM